MKTEIITINGRNYTRIVKDADLEWIKGELKKGNPVVVALENLDDYRILKEWNGKLELYYSSDENIFFDKNITHTIHTLDPLPRYPTANDAALLYEYASHGLFAVFHNELFNSNKYFIGFNRHTTQCWMVNNQSGDNSEWKTKDGLEITHCINQAGEKCEVAIDD